MYTQMNTCIHLIKEHLCKERAQDKGSLVPEGSVFFFLIQVIFLYSLSNTETLFKHRISGRGRTSLSPDQTPVNRRRTISNLQALWCRWPLSCVPLPLGGGTCVTPYLPYGILLAVRKQSWSMTPLSPRMTSRGLGAWDKPPHIPSSAHSLDGTQTRSFPLRFTPM